MTKEHVVRLSRRCFHHLSSTTQGISGPKMTVSQRVKVVLGVLQGRCATSNQQKACFIRMLIPRKLHANVSSSGDTQPLPEQRKPGR